MNDYSSLLAVATDAVAIGCRLIREQKPGILTAKGDRDYASSVDYLIEREIRGYLAGKTPEIGFLGEEEGATDRKAELIWSLDPIDGTVNFVHGLPLCAVSLGLVRQGRTVLGVVELPFLGGQYSAVEGGGSHIGTERIQVSRAPSL